MYNYLDIVPEVTTGIINKVAFNTAKKQIYSCKVKAGKDNVNGTVKLELPSNWTVTLYQFLLFKTKERSK
jgi:hypothetical protein